MEVPGLWRGRIDYEERVMGECVVKRHDDGRIEIVQADPEVQIAGEVIRNAETLLNDQVSITLNLPGGRAYKLGRYDELADVFDATLIDHG